MYNVYLSHRCQYEVADSEQLFSIIVANIRKRKEGCVQEIGTSTLKNKEIEFVKLKQYLIMIIIIYKYYKLSSYHSFKIATKKNKKSILYYKD